MAGQGRLKFLSLVFLCIFFIHRPLFANNIFVLDSPAPYFMSKILHTYVPGFSVQLIHRWAATVDQAFEKQKTTHPKAYKAYQKFKTEFFSRVSPQGVDQFVAHMTWYPATVIPFEKLSFVSDPAKLFALPLYALLKVFVQENLLEKDLVIKEGIFYINGKPLGLKKGKALKVPEALRGVIRDGSYGHRAFWKHIFPERLETFDVKLKGPNGQNPMVSFYRGRRGEVRVKESIYSPFNGFIERVEFTANRHEAYVHLNRERLGLAPGAPSSIHVRFPEEFLKYGMIEPSHFSVEELNHGADRAILETYKNPFGRRAELKGSEYFYSAYGQGVRVPLSEVFHKASNVIISSNLTWVSFEVFRQLYTSWGASNLTLNLTPYLFHSYGLLTLFTVGGYFGEAMGSSLVHQSGLSGEITRRASRELLYGYDYTKGTLSRLLSTPRHFLDLFHKTPNVCQPLLGKIFQKPLQFSDREAVHQYLVGKYGSNYAGIVGGELGKIGGVAVGGFLSWLLPYLNKKSQISVFDFLTPRKEIPEIQREKSPEDENYFPEFPVGVLQKTEDPMIEKMAHVVSAFSLSSTQSLMKLQQNYLSENGLDLPPEYKPLPEDWVHLYNHLVEVHKDQFEELKTSDPETYRKLLFLQALIGMPQQQLQKEFSTRVSNAQSPVELKKILNEYLDKTYLVNLAPEFLALLKNEKSLETMKEKTLSFISSSEALIYSRQIEKIQKELAEEVL